VRPCGRSHPRHALLCRPAGLHRSRWAFAFRCRGLEPNLPAVPPDPRSRIDTPPSRASSREEHVTETGWRVVGRAIPLVTQAAEATLLAGGRDEDVLYAARFRLRPRLGRDRAATLVLAALGAAVTRTWPDAPPLLPDRPLARPPERYHGLSWETSGGPGAWTGELIWRHPHPVIRGVPCTTHVIVEEQAGHTLLTVRVSADGGLASVRGLVGAGQARPAFLSELRRTLHVSFDEGDSQPRILGEGDIEGFVRDVLLSERRAHPVALLAPLEEGEYLIAPDELADELLGLAHLYVVDRHPTTFRLTDSLGDRRLSCFFGALRVYLSGFSCAERPEDHPLLLRDRLVDPVVRTELVGRLGQLAAQRVRMPRGVIAPPPSTTTGAPLPRPASGPTEGPPRPVAAPETANTPPALEVVPAATGDTVAAPDASALGGGTALPTVLAGLGAQIGALAETIGHLVDANAALRDEIARLRTTTAVRATSTTALERRIGSLEHLLARAQPIQPEPEAPQEGDAIAAAAAAAEDEGEDERLTLVDVLRQAAATHGDALLLLDAAERAAADSPYEDVDRVAVVLDAMAVVARRRQEGALGISLREAFREMGIDYRGAISSTTSEKHRQQYLVHGGDGQFFDCREHIVLGSAYDPRYCLRIYFTSRAPVEPRFVIGHVGRHFDVATTT